MPQPRRIGVLTSGGDAQGMNAAVRAVVRGAIALGAEPYAIEEGWQGAVDGGQRIHPIHWADVSAILDRGGTIIGTARSEEFRQRPGRKRAALHLVRHGIDHLVVIGGDGSLTGSEILRSEWSSLLAELVREGELAAEVAAQHAELRFVGLVGSIDNDLIGTDITIGADTALHRIIAAIDQISSTAASHQRTFVLEVMGRHCGYLPLMAAVAGGADEVLIPELPPPPGWEDALVDKLRMGREAGRRESLILVAEGAIDQQGRRIDAQSVAAMLKEKRGEDARVTILGHVQRGGTPSAFDRWMPTVLGFAAVQELLRFQPGSTPVILGVRRNRIVRLPLTAAVQATRAVARAVEERRYDDAVVARGETFTEMLRINDIMARPPAADVTPQDRAASSRVAILHAGGLAPGMNTAARAAVRLGIAQGYAMLGVQGGFPGLLRGDVRELTWAEVDSWAFHGGAALGTRRTVPTVEQLYALGRSIETARLDALLVIGGFDAYLAAHLMAMERDRYPAFRIPIMCVPASIDNNLPGSELAIGADTALNNAIMALDRIKESAAASRRCFVAEVMGRHCGYLTVMAGISAGAELVYTHERGMTLAGIAADAAAMRASFEAGRRLFLVLRNEAANEQYNLDFMGRAFEEEGGGLFDVRTHAIGHLQQGGSPSPFDRVLATRLVYYALEELDRQLEADTCETGACAASYVGYSSNHVEVRPLERMMDDVDREFRRPREQWWRAYEPALAVSFRGNPVSGEIPVLDAS